MISEIRETLLSRFVFSADPIPRTYGRLIPLRRFIEEINEGKHRPYTGTGYLVLDNKFVEQSENWVRNRLVPLENGYMSLEALDKTIKELHIFWVTATELLF